MISNIRSYFDTQVKAIDPSINAWSKDLFGNNDLSKHQASNYYNLIIGPMESEKDGNGIQDNFQVFLDIYVSTKRDILTSFDELYDKAILIRNEVIDPVNINNANFSDIVNLSIEPIEEESNDKTVKMRLEFNIRKDCRFI
jgi:hypothetical protein